MIKFDYHTHSDFSNDSIASMPSMVEAAYRIGFEQIAITDHFDPDYANPNEHFDPDYIPYHAAISRLQEEYCEKIRVLRGLEIGVQKHVIRACEDAAHDYPYDFIIASFHCAEKKELYGGDFFRGRSLAESYEAFYRYVYDCLKQYKDYSVVGHFNIIERYSDGVCDPGCYTDIVDETFKRIIQDGKGLELNTSSFRYGMGDDLTPSLSMLKRYRALGGEIITVGSDAHRPKDIGDHFQFAEDLLRRIGFQYVTVFDQMKPAMKPL